jgi:hypothetical protein
MMDSISSHILLSERDVDEERLDSSRLLEMFTSAEVSLTFWETMKISSGDWLVPRDAAVSNVS